MSVPSSQDILISTTLRVVFHWAVRAGLRCAKGVSMSDLSRLSWSFLGLCTLEFSTRSIVSSVLCDRRSSLLRCRRYRLPLRFGRRSGGFFVQERTEINQYPCQDKSVFIFLFFTTTAAERPRNAGRNRIRRLHYETIRILLLLCTPSTHCAGRAT